MLNFSSASHGLLRVGCALQELRRQVEELGMGERVRFLPSFSDR
jgi:hypothetical protein